MEWFMSLEGVSELESAEDFLHHFCVPHDPAQVRHLRLHLMHGFHQRLAELSSVPPDAAGRFALAQGVLTAVYQGLAQGCVAEQSSLRVYRRLDPLFIPLSSLSEVSL